MFAVSVMTGPLWSSCHPSHSLEAPTSTQDKAMNICSKFPTTLTTETAVVFKSW